MKKLFVLLFAAFLLTGCNSTEEKINKSLTNFKNLESVNAKIDIAMDFTTNGEQYNVGMSIEEKVAKSGDMSLNGSVTYNGMTLSLDAYLSLINEDIQAYVKLPNDATWYSYLLKGYNKKDSETINTEELSEKYKKVMELIIENKKIEEIKDEKLEKGSSLYLISLNKETLKKVVKELNTEYTEEQINDTFKNIKDEGIKIKLYINKNDQIEKLVFDFKDTFNLSEINSATMTMTFTDHNNIETIEIPSSVKSNSKKLTDENIMEIFMSLQQLTGGNTNTDDEGYYY